MEVLEGKGIHLGNGRLSTDTSLGSELELPSLFSCSLGKIREEEKGLYRGEMGTATGMRPQRVS